MRSDYLDKEKQGRQTTPRAPRGLGWKTILITMLVVLGIILTVTITKLVVGAVWPGDKEEGGDLEAAVGQELLNEQSRLEVDQDGDGLTDLLENIYRSDPAQSDTDGDGTSDGEEVETGRDPVTAGPNDVFNLEVAENLLAEESYSKKYIATLPPDVTQEELLDETRITAFIEQERGELIGEISNTEISVIAATDEAAVKIYLDTVSANTNSEIATVTHEDIDQAFRLNYQLGQAEAIDTIIKKLQGNVAILEKTAVPTPAVEVHKKLLGASRALLENVQLLKRMPEDLVGGLLAARNIEDLGEEFAVIATEVADLEAEYNLE